MTTGIATIPRKQAAKMARTAASWRGRAAYLRGDGNTRAADLLDIDAAAMESDLRTYGYGRLIRTAR